ncbi:hypothetical protein [Ramlibacter rhizophilus]|uniref:Uncharacterized protein n=1 Tax=Ramlibacter rhizophilus TaxID=1781167 RepID=A0A4Z0C256_9BURK|nr:hypothetical protein [Ramlibacter rhizophilus]TFZ05032.1 hypothetical protein EZ242_04600 [Ramlibacter rhizophilus]
MLRQSFREAWKDAGAVRYDVPGGDAELRATQALMDRLLQGDRSREVDERAAELGWRLRRGQAGKGRWTVLEELPGRRSGRGLYAFADEGGQHAIQAPHVPSDLHTGEIAVAMGEQAQPRAIAWNTVPRREADLPHLHDSALHAFSRAFASRFPQQRIIQLHGFDADRDDRAGDKAQEAIVSSAARPPSPAARAVADCMRSGVEPATRLFGVDAQRLGGTRNRIARELAASGFHGFVHLEMGLDLRRSLRDDARRRGALLTCLGVPQ